MYDLNFQVMTHFKWSLEELEMMIPWEREVYVTLLTQYVEEEKKRLEKLSNKR